MGNVALTIVLTFIGGAMGSMFSPMIMVIAYAWSAILAPVIGNTFFEQDIVNIMLLPCVAFAGGIPAIAFAANTRKHGVSGLDIFVPNWNATNDWLVHMVGGIFGVLGYALMELCVCLHIPGDAGAISIVAANVILRKICYRQKLITCDPSQMGEIWKHLISNKSKQLITPVIWGAFVGLVVCFTGNTSIMFCVSAITLIVIFFEPRFPVTHHMSVAASLAAAAFGNSMAMNMIAGAAGAVLASAVFEISNVWIGHGKFKENHREISHKYITYIDPPSCAVTVSSIVIALLAGLISH